MKYIYIDFEYKNAQNKHPELVCVAFQVDKQKPKTIWLHNGLNKGALTALLKDYIRRGYAFVSFAVTAEARCFSALGIDPTEVTWIDLYLEWRQIRNGCDKYNYGTYYLNNLKITSVPPIYNNPKRNEGKNNTPLAYSLSACCARLLKVNIDKGLKTDMRNLILSDVPDYSEADKADILEYCLSDIKYLPLLREQMTSILKEKTSWTYKRIIEAQIKRGVFASHVALMEDTGIPLHIDSITNLRRNVELAKDTLISNLVENYYPFFTKAKKRKRDLLGYWRDTYANFKHFIENHESIDASKWKTTDSGRYCADDEYLKSREGIPEIKEYREVRKILGQLKWLREPEEGEEDLFDSIGEDDKMRTFFGIYGTQTARNAPKAKKFVFAMSAWLRCLIRPPVGYVITEIDYASQEFAIAAILSEDKNMVGAYKSGDPYLYFAKKAGAVPEDGTKDEYKEERNLFKATTLGLQYGMGVKSLAIKLSSDTGKNITERQAEKLINLHKRVYPTYWRWLKRIDYQYARKKFLSLPCDWVLFGDNPSPLSVRNFPTQGAGSSVIREAVSQCKINGIEIVATLHDAIYIISKESETSKDIETASRIMKDSFDSILQNNKLDIRLDVSSHSSEDPWISEKGERFYHILKEYLGPKETKSDVKKRLLETIYS